MSDVTYPIPVAGGTLRLCLTPYDDPEAPPELTHGSGFARYHFEYEGTLPRDMGLELVRQAPGGGRDMTVNDMPLIEFLESL